MMTVIWMESDQTPAAAVVWDAFFTHSDLYTEGVILIVDVLRCLYVQLHMSGTTFRRRFISVTVTSPSTGPVHSSRTRESVHCCVWPHASHRLGQTLFLCHFITCDTTEGEGRSKGHKIEWRGTEKTGERERESERVINVTFKKCLHAGERESAVGSIWACRSPNANNRRCKVPVSTHRDPRSKSHRSHTHTHTLIPAGSDARHPACKRYHTLHLVLSGVCVSQGAAGARQTTSRVLVTHTQWWSVIKYIYSSTALQEVFDLIYLSLLNLNKCE